MIDFWTWYDYLKNQIMFLSLFNSQASNYEYLNNISAKKVDIFVIIYSDNIFIFTWTLDLQYINIV